MKVPTLGLCVVLLLSSLGFAGGVNQPTVAQPGNNQPYTAQPGVTQPTVNNPVAIQPSARQATPPGVQAPDVPMTRQVYAPNQPVLGQVSAPSSVATACGCGQQH